jgi:hypothetical protein
MSDYCKQCSEELFDQDFGDLALGNALRGNGLLECQCEGCGMTVVDKHGVCIGRCLKDHGNMEISGLLDISFAKTEPEQERKPEWEDG